LLQYLAVKVDVQVEPLAAAAGIELERRFRPAEFELVKALLGERVAHFTNVVGQRGRSPGKSDKNQRPKSEPCSHGSNGMPHRA
jgi:hypothetical protein